MAIKNKLIFVTSVESWGEVWFCKHHYAYELSRNNTVYFLNGQTKWRIKNLFSTRLTINFVKENLYLVDYENNFPIVFFKPFFLFLNDLVNSWKLNTIVKRNNEKEIIFWQFDPYRFISVFFKKTFKRIFHVADSYVILCTDLQIAKRCDLIICTSPDFINRYEVCSKNVIFIPHGVSKDEIETDSNSVNMIKKTYGNFIINIATIINRIDFDLLDRITDELTDLNLLCIGPVRILDKSRAEKWERLFNKKNFFHINQINGKILKNYVAAAKICINAEKYNIKEKHLFRSSLKFYNYLAQSKPIVSCLLHDLEFLNNKVAYIKNNPDEYIRYLKLLNSDKLPYDAAMAKQFINDAEYSLLIEKIDEHLYAEK